MGHQPVKQNPKTTYKKQKTEKKNRLTEKL